MDARHSLEASNRAAEPIDLEAGLLPIEAPMADPRDIVDIATLRREPEKQAPRAFLSIWYRCCHVYGRLYKNAAGTKYNGCCPRCASRAHVLVRPDGTTRRCFQAVD